MSNLKNNKAYYHFHEKAYQHIKAKGQAGWGNAKTFEELGDAKTKEYLAQAIAQFIPDAKGTAALDLGCGTGTTAFVLADLGFVVTGLDISETAIQMAQEFSRAKNYLIHFQVQDILNLEGFEKKFNLIYDSHCLHCIVFDQDRKTALSQIKRSLSAEGIFILDTMVMPYEGFDFTNGNEFLRFDQQHILWHKSDTTVGYGVTVLDGKSWCAQRRLYPSATVEAEIKAAGFQVVAKSLELQNEGEPLMLRMILK